MLVRPQTKYAQSSNRRDRRTACAKMKMVPHFRHVATGVVVLSGSGFGKVVGW